MYYSIDEDSARRAKEATSFSDYEPNSATENYRAAVDKVSALVERKKSSVSSYYHDKLDALLDQYARRLAQWTNDYNRNSASCPSVLISGPANFPVKKKARQNAREESLWAEYKDIQSIVEKIKGVGTGPIDFADPNAREMLVDRLESLKALLDRYKAMNAYYRKNKTMKGFFGHERR